MTRQSIQQASKVKASSTTGIVLQRKCSCGNTPESEGECAENKKGQLQRSIATTSAAVGLQAKPEKTSKKKPAKTAKKRSAIPQKCGRRSKKVPGNHITKVNIEVGSNTLTIEWQNPATAPAGSAGTHAISPGAGLCCVDCNDEKTSQTSGSLCTPKGGEWSVFNTACALGGHPTAKNPTYFQRAGVAIHSGNTSAPPQSHGCARTSSEISQLIHDNVVIGQTKIASSGTWSGSTCYSKEASNTLRSRAKVCDGNKVKSKKNAGVVPAETSIPSESNEAVPVTQLGSNDETPIEMIADGPGPYNDSLSAEAVADSQIGNDDLTDDETEDESIFPPTSTLGLQAKVTVNTPGDKYEQEADRVAEHVMRMPEPQVQRQCACGKSSTEGECDDCKKKKQVATGSLQRVATSPVGGIAAPPIVNDVLSSPGSPLPTGTRSFMESRFGQDFSSVRVHTDQRAAKSAEAVHARAYTVGHNIVFGNGEYPTRDQYLLAHELAHVLQQQGTSNFVRRQATATVVRKASELALKWLANRGKTVSAHIAKRHVAHRLGKSTFKAGGKDVNKLLTRTIKSADRTTPQGRRIVFEKAFEREVGQKGETVIRIVVDKLTGKIVTAFPTRTMLSLTGTAVASAASAASNADTRIQSRRDTIVEALKPSLLEQVLDFVVGTSTIARDEDILAEERIIDAAVVDAIRDIENEEQRSLGPEECEEVRVIIETEMELTPTAG